jgi:hypothetical protein
VGGSGGSSTAARDRSALRSARLLVYNAARREEVHEAYTVRRIRLREDSPVEKFYRDATIGAIDEGTSNRPPQTIG